MGPESSLATPRPRLLAEAFACDLGVSVWRNFSEHNSWGQDPREGCHSRKQTALLGPGLPRAEGHTGSPAVVPTPVPAVSSGPEWRCHSTSCLVMCREGRWLLGSKRAASFPWGPAGGQRSRGGCPAVPSSGGKAGGSLLRHTGHRPGE